MKTKLRNGLILVTLFVLGCAFFLTSDVTAAEPIKIGVPGPFTGFLATDGQQMKNGIEMWAEEVNGSGGLLGRPIEIIYGDTGGQEAEKMIAVGQMLMSKKIDAAITGYAPAPTDVRFFGQYEIPFLHADTSFMATNPVKEGLPDKMWNIFQYDPNAEEWYGLDALRYFVEKAPGMMGWTPPNKKVAVIAVDYPYNLDCAVQFKEVLPEGYEVVVDEITPFGVSDWGAVLAKIRAYKPAFITFWNLSPADTARFVTQFVENPTNSLFYAQYSPNVPEFANIAKDAANGVIYASLIAGVGERYKGWVDRYKSKYGAEPYGAIQIYDGAGIWAAAVKRAGSVTAYRDIARYILEYSFDGYCGRYVFNHHDQSALHGEGLIPDVFYQIQDGKAEVIFPENYATGKPQLPPWIKK